MQAWWAEPTIRWCRQTAQPALGRVSSTDQQMMQQHRCAVPYVAVHLLNPRLLCANSPHPSTPQHSSVRRCRCWRGGGRWPATHGMSPALCCCGCCCRVRQSRSPGHRQPTPVGQEGCQCRSRSLAGEQQSRPCGCEERCSRRSTPKHGVCVEEVGPTLMQWQSAQPREVEACHGSPALTRIGSAGVLAGARQ